MVSNCKINSSLSKKERIVRGGYERRMFAPQSAAYLSQSRYADGMRDMPQERKQQDAAWSILWSERKLCSDYTTWRIAHTGCPRHQIIYLRAFIVPSLASFSLFRTRRKGSALLHCSFKTPLSTPPQPYARSSSDSSSQTSRVVRGTFSSPSDRRSSRPGGWSVRRCSHP